MQTIRLARSWRKNRPFFRVVLTDSKASPKAWYKQVLGRYNPLTKEEKYDVESIVSFVSFGTQMSSRVAKLLFSYSKNELFQKFFEKKDLVRAPKSEKK